MKTKAANTIRGIIKKKNTRSPSLNAVFFSREENCILIIIKLEVNSNYNTVDDCKYFILIFTFKCQNDIN